MEKITIKTIIPQGSRLFQRKTFPFEFVKPYQNLINKNIQVPNSKIKYQPISSKLRENQKNSITFDLDKKNNLTEKKIDYLPKAYEVRNFNWSSERRKPIITTMSNQHSLRTITPKKYYSFMKDKGSNLDFSNSLQDSYFKSTKEMSSNTYNKQKKNKIRGMKNKTIFPISFRDIININNSKVMTYNNAKYNINSDYNCYTINNINNIDNVKNKEIKNLNNIINSQNKNLRQTIKEMRLKINDLLNDIKLLRLENNRLNGEKKKLLIRISNLENEINVNKNLSFNELELKSNKITLLNENIIKLNALLNEKENQIINLNNLHNGNNNNNLFQQINDLKDELKKLRKEKNELNKKVMKNGSISISFNGKITNLIQENQKLKNMNNNFKNENEKIKNYLSNIKNEKLSIEKNYNSLSHKLNELKSENEFLKKTKEKNLKNRNTNKEEQLIDQVNKLLEENNRLKENLNQNNIDIENNNNNHFQELNFMKKELEEKTKKIKELNEKMNILMNQYNILKDKNEDLHKINSQLKSDLDKLRLKMSTSDNSQRQFVDLNKQNYNSNSLNNNQLEQIKKLEEKNKELNKKLDECHKSIRNKIDVNKILRNENQNSVLKKELMDLKNKLDELQQQIEMKEKENKRLLNILKIKNEEANQHQEEVTRTNQVSSSGIFNIMDMNEEIKELKNIIDEKNNKITKLSKEIEQYKNNNNKLSQENEQIKEKLQLLENGNGEGLIITLNNLKEELKDKNLQIEKLINENNILKKTLTEKVIVDENDKSFSSLGLDKSEKIKMLQEEIKEINLMSYSDQIQIKTLKEDIKGLQSKLKNIETLNGQMKDFNEFTSLINQAFLNYKPKKKEQKDALNRITEVINNFRI